MLSQLRYRLIEEEPDTSPNHWDMPKLTIRKENERVADRRHTPEADVPPVRISMGMGMRMAQRRKLGQLMMICPEEHKGKVIYTFPHERENFLAMLEDHYMKTEDTPVFMTGLDILSMFLELARYLDDDKHPKRARLEMESTFHAIKESLRAGGFVGSEMLLEHLGKIDTFFDVKKAFIGFIDLYTETIQAVGQGKASLPLDRLLKNRIHLPSYNPSPKKE